MYDEHMQIDSFAPVIEMDVLANEETSGSEQYSSPTMQDDYSEDEDSFAGIVYLIYMDQVIAKQVVVVKTRNCPQKDF